jgi:hypothetical protein
MLRPICQTVDSSSHAHKQRISTADAGGDLGIHRSIWGLSFGRYETLSCRTLGDFVVVEWLVSLFEDFFSCFEKPHCLTL